MLIYTPLIAELGTFVLAAFVFYGLFRRFGTKVAVMFILGSVAWTTPLETLGILTGSYSYRGYFGSLFPHYPGYLVWIGVVPLWVEMGWFIVSASSFVIFHDVLLSKSRALVVAIFSGLFAVNMDLLIDPVASSNNLWIWQGQPLGILGIPLYNYFGWFMMIFAYDLIIWHTVVNFKSMRGLSIIERFLFSFKWDLNSVADSLRIRGFIFRLAILEVVVIILIKTASLIP